MDLRNLKNKIIKTTVNTLQNYTGDNLNVRNFIDDFTGRFSEFKSQGTTDAYKGMMKGADAKIHTQHSVKQNIAKLRK